MQERKEREEREEGEVDPSTFGFLFLIFFFFLDESNGVFETLDVAASLGDQLGCPD